MERDKITPEAQNKATKIDPKEIEKAKKEREKAVKNEKIVTKDE